MQERWMVDRARDRLIVTPAMMQCLHDQLRFGLLPPALAETAAALILAQLEQTIRLVEDASRGLRGAPLISAVDLAVGKPPAAVNGAAGWCHERDKRQRAPTPAPPDRPTAHRAGHWLAGLLGVMLPRSA